MLTYCRIPLCWVAMYELTVEATQSKDKHIYFSVTMGMDFFFSPFLFKVF